MKKRYLFIILSSMMFIGITLSMVLLYKQNLNNQKVDDTLLVETINNNNFIKLKKERIKRNLAHSGTYKISATINTSDIANNKINWNLKWKDGTNANISNYITISVASDTFSVTLTQKEQFSQQIILTAASTLNPDIKATCTLDCYKRFADINLETLNYDTDGGEAPQLATIDNINNKITYSLDESKSLDIADFDFIDNLKINSAVGTVDFKYNCEIIVKVSNELESYISNQNPITKQVSSFNNDGNITFYYSLYDVLGFNSSSDSEYFNQVMYQLSLIDNIDHWFDLTITITGTVNGEAVNLSKTYQMCGFNSNYYKNLYSNVNIKLSTNNYIF